MTLTPNTVYEFKVLPGYSLSVSRAGTSCGVFPNKVVPPAYIYTIMVAFQGLFILIVFVPLSSAVREAYAKWWRHKVKESYILSKFNISSSSKLTPFTKVIINCIIPTSITKEFQFCYSIDCVNEITKIVYYE